jgi:signal transduction histidine kinase
VRSLRGRLTLGVVVVLAGVLAVAGVTVSRYVSRSERAAFDDRLQRTAELSRETALAAIEQELPGNDRRLDAVLDATSTSLRVLLGDRTLLDTGAPPPVRPRVVDGARTFTAEGVRYRTYTVSLQDAQLGGLARLEVTSRLTGLERRLSALNRRLLALGLLALAVSGAGAWLAADLVLRPLRRLRAVTGSIAGDEDLGRRVPAGAGPAETRALAASFNDMLARLGRSAADRERALEATRRFAADAGHELRTPLTSVQATLSALGRHPDAPVARREALVRDALAEQARLVTLLDGLQALARGGAAPEHADVDVADVTDAAVQAAAARHRAVRWSVEVPDAPVVVRGWEPGLRVLVENLVENAARHGRDGGQVAVTLVDGARPELRVEDDGPGIPETERERIFAPFARLDGTEAPGSGLGLALVAQQVRQHDAEIAVERSRALGGAAFRVTFAGAPHAR